MSELLSDQLNLDLLKCICQGEGVEVNVNSLSKTFKKHRNTIKMHLNDLIDNRIIDGPAYPLLWTFREYPLLVIARSDLPRSDEVHDFIIEDEHIAGAFNVRDEEYNMLFMEFHEDLFLYEEWRDRIVQENRIPPREKRYPANSLFFSNRKMIKYQPHSSIGIMERRLKKNGHIDINGARIDPLSFSILKKIMTGEGIRTVENTLSKKLEVHRKTVERRISALMEQGIISKPVCIYPEWLVPPDHILVYYMVEARRSRANIIREIKRDPHIPMALHAHIGGYNLLVFGVFSNVESHFIWEESYENKFPGCFGRMKKIYLSPKMTTTIDFRKVSIGILKKYQEKLRSEK